MHNVGRRDGQLRLGASSSLVIGHAVMKDAIDAAAVRAALGSVGLQADGASDAAIGERIVNIFAKAEASPDGVVRGLRHTMLTIPTSVPPATPVRRSGARQRLSPEQPPSTFGRRRASGTCRRRAGRRDRTRLIVQVTER